MSKKSKILFLLALLVAMSVTLTACIPGDGSYTGNDPAGFFSGIWHGWISPISLIIGIFDRNIRVYESANTGWWYDLGFYMAIISGFGGLSLSRKHRKNKKSVE